MDARRWNEIIENAAGQAIDEAGLTVQSVALKAATLAAEAIAEALAEEQRLEEQT